MVHGAVRRSWAELRSAAAARVGAGARAASARAIRWRLCCQHPRRSSRPLRRADGRRGVEHHQHPAGPRDHRLHPRPRRGEDPRRRPRIRARSGQALARQGRAPGHRDGRPSAAPRPAARRASGYEACSRKATRPTWALPADEWDAIALNYTSGTTGRPKGVVYHHRGAQLLATGNVLSASMARHPVYLWTLPMFHCNGWCFPWTVAPWWAPMSAFARCAARRLVADGRTRRDPYVRRAGGDATMLDTPAAQQQALPKTVNSSSRGRRRRKRCSAG